MNQLKCGVIGAGYIGKEHARVYSECPETELTTIIDVDESQATTIGDRYDVDHIETDIDAGLATESLDLVTIATPKEHHREPTRRALEADCHVLLEKPIAESEEDARAIGEYADEADTSLAVGYLLRFDPRYARLKASIKEFGTVLGLHAERITKASVYRRASEMTHPVYYLAVHDIDMLRWYTEAEVTDVYATASDGPEGGEGPGIIHGTLRFGNGAVGTLEANWVRPDNHPSHRTEKLRVTGTEGCGEIDLEPGGDIPIVSDGTFRYGSTSELHGTIRGPLRNQIDHMAACIRTDSQPLVTWEDGLHSLRVAHAIKESIDTGEEISLQE